MTSRSRSTPSAALAAGIPYLAGRGLLQDPDLPRIVAGFVIQGGGRRATAPAATATWWSRSRRAACNAKGVVAMAKGGAEPPERLRRRWFVVTRRGRPAAADSTRWGTSDRGQDVVDEIGAVPATPDEQPADPVVIRSVGVSKP